MSKKAYSSHEIIKILKDAGFELDRIKGSHHIFISSSKQKTGCCSAPEERFALWNHKCNTETSWGGIDQAMTTIN